MTIDELLQLAGWYTEKATMFRDQHADPENASYFYQRALDLLDQTQDMQNANITAETPIRPYHPMGRLKGTH